MLKKLIRIAALSISVSALIIAVIFYFDPEPESFISRFKKETVASRLAQFGETVELRLRPTFEEKKIQFPPKSVKLVFIKDEKLLKLYAGNTLSDITLVKSYAVKAASGKPGPKLREGDMQVPEGIYRVESLNPNSLFHLALRVNYPNSYDKSKAEQDGRTNLGSDIMIHGKNVSVGCIAIGDEAIEELFVLAGKTKYQDWELIFMPTDLTIKDRPQSESLPKWIGELDTEIRKHLSL